MKVRAAVWASIVAGWCSGCDSLCDSHPIYAFKNNPGEAGLASNDERAMVIWSHITDGWNNQTLHVAALDRDGAIGPDTQLDESLTYELTTQWNALGGAGVAGATTVLWGSSGRCFDAPGSPGGNMVGLRPFAGALVTFDGSTPASLVDVSGSEAGTHAVVFDGSTYHAFWIAEGRQLRHRIVDETGVLGAVHELGEAPASNLPGVLFDDICLAVASDRAGTTMVAVSTWTQTYALIVDATGQARRIWDSPLDWQSGRGAFWLGGEFHLLGRRTTMVGGQQMFVSSVITSFDSITATARTRELSMELADVAFVRASAANIYLLRATELVELDPDLGILNAYPARGWDSLTSIRDSAVLLGSRMAYVVDIPSLEDVPGRIQVVQLGETGDEAWRADVDVSSDLTTTQSTCGPHTH